MKFKEFLNDPDWDAPFFKVLSHNDTGQGRGHQGGIVLPKQLRVYLPELDITSTSKQSPTVDRWLDAELYVGTKMIEMTPLRYQVQTWSGERTAESRITAGLSPLRNEAKGGDILIFQRSIDELNRFRLILVRQGQSGFTSVLQATADKTWGALDSNRMPATQTDLNRASVEIEKVLQTKFEFKLNTPVKHQSTVSRIARNAAFREIVRGQYDFTCAITGQRLRTPSGCNEVEAAHVIPRNLDGPDDPRNGIALTHTMHWAFDRGLFGVGRDRKVYIPRKVRSDSCNSELLAFEGTQISEAKSKEHRVHETALEWHMENIVRQLD